MKFNKDVFKSLALVGQVGISMAVPIVFCAFVGSIIDNRFGTSLFIPFVIIGILSGFRNIYYMTKSFYTKRENNDKEDNEQK